MIVGGILDCVAKTKIEKNRTTVFTLIEGLYAFM